VITLQKRDVSMSEIISPLAYQLGLGGIGGFIVGYAVKKISKLIAILIGLFIIALIYLGTQGIISINYWKLFEALKGALGLAGQAAEWFIGLISILPFMGSFVAGFLLGFKLG
jgi:uncharacterized membrane protein (Fun14 family)